MDSAVANVHVLSGKLGLRLSLQAYVSGLSLLLSIDGLLLTEFVQLSLLDRQLLKTSLHTGRLEPKNDTFARRLHLLLDVVCVG